MLQPVDKIQPVRSKQKQKKEELKLVSLVVSVGRLLYVAYKPTTLSISHGPSTCISVFSFMNQSCLPTARILQRKYSEHFAHFYFCV